MKPSTQLLLLSLLLLVWNRSLAQSNAPTNLSGTAPAYNQVVLTWKDNSTGETRFEIERNNFAGFTKIGEAAANATTYTDNTVGGGTYRVRAILSTGAATGYSNEFTISTPPEPPTVPTSLAATAQSANSIHLTWTNSGGASATDFLLERGTSSGGPFAQIAVVVYSRTPAYDDNGALSGTQYCYRVRARGTGGTSGYSNTACASTPNAPSNVKNLTAQATGSSSIKLTWTGFGKESGIDIERRTGQSGTWGKIASVLGENAQYTDNGLSATTEYCYRIFEAGHDYSAIVCATTATPPIVIPNAPARLAAVAASPTQINLTWVDVSDNETGFQVERASSATAPFTKIADLGVNTQTFSDNGLTGSTQYCYRVRAINTAGASGYTDVACTVTLTPPVPPPTSPTGLAATAASSTQINLSWTDNASNETGFELERSTDGTNFSKIADLGANITTYANTGLPAATRYFYRVRATNAGGASGYSNVADATTADVVPNAPVRLTAQASSFSQINLIWADVSGNETGFELERSTDGTNFSKIADLGANTTNYTNTGLNGSTHYFYRVRAINGIGVSGYSNVADVTTPAAPVPPPASPTGLAATAASSTQINLSWTDNATNETGFELERSTDGVNFARIADVPANAITYQHTGLTPATHYFYRIRAVNQGGGSAYSNVADATTADVVPNAPGRLTATAVSSTQINLQWADLSGNETGFEVERSADGNTWAKLANLPANTTTYQSVGLTPVTRYVYRVRAINAIGPSGYSNTADATTFDVPPAAPANLTAQASSFSAITLTWTNSATNVTGIDIDRSTDGTTFTKIASVGSTVATYVDTGLIPATRYYYRVRANNTVGQSAYSPVANAITPDVAPVAPGRLTAQATSYSAISLTWADLSGNETGFEIEQSTDGTTFTRIGTTGPNAISFGQTGLAGSTHYFFRIRAVNAIGPSGYSNTADATTPQAPLPGTPTNLTAIPVDFDLIKLTWSPVSANTTTVVVERSLSSASGFIEIGKQSPAKNEFNDVGVLPVATYYYRIKAVNSAGSSAYSNVAKIDADAIINGTPEPVGPAFDLYVADRVLYLKTDQLLDATIQIVNMQGVAMLEKKVNLQGGDRYQYPLQILSAGLYIVAVQTGQSLITKKIVLP